MKLFIFLICIVVVIGAVCANEVHDDQGHNHDQGHDDGRVAAVKAAGPLTKQRMVCANRRCDSFINEN